MLCPNCGNQTPLYKKTCIHCNYDLAKISVEDLLSDVSLDTLEQELDSISSERGLSIGDVIAGRYQIKALIGRGSFGAAYRAQDLERGDLAVVKVLHEKFFRNGSPAVRDRLDASLATAKALSHANIIAIREIVEEQGLILVVSDHEVALPLAKLIAARESKATFFTLDYVLDLFDQVYRALSYAHATTFHGNLTPDNVMVRKESVKIADFGIAAGILPDIPTQVSSTFKGQSYRGPETLEAPERLGPASDVYSCGSILYRMLNLTELREVPEYTLEFEERYPSAIKQVIAKATESSPADRYPDVEAFFNSLANVAAAARPSAPPAPEVEPEPVAADIAPADVEIEPVDVFAESEPEPAAVPDEEEEQIDVFADEPDETGEGEAAVHFGSIAADAGRTPDAPEPDDDLLPDLDGGARFGRKPEPEPEPDVEPEPEPEMPVTVRPESEFDDVVLEEPPSDILSAPEPEFIPTPESDPNATPVPEPDVESEPEPEPDVEPEPAPELPTPPEPTAVETPAPESEPEPEAEPEIEPEPEPEPEPEAEPEPESPFVDPSLPADQRPRPIEARRSAWPFVAAIVVALAIAGGGLYYLLTVVLPGAETDVPVQVTPPVPVPPAPMVVPEPVVPPVPEPAPETEPEAEPTPEALAPEPAPEPAPRTDPTNAERARALVAEGDAFVQRNRLTAPPEENAVERYRAALELDPGNADATVGLSRVVEKYIEMGDRSRDGRNYNQAGMYYEKALTVDDRSVTARKRLEDLDRRRGAAEPATPTPPAPARPAPPEETVNLADIAPPAAGTPGLTPPEETVDLNETTNLEEEVNTASPAEDELVNLANIAPPPTEPEPPAETPPAEPAAPPADAGSEEPAAPPAGASEKGTIDIEEVKAVIRSYMGRIKICYKTGLDRNPDLKGEVKVLFTIGTDGRVTSSRIAESTLGDADVENCILRRFRRMEFPAPSGGEVTIKYPLVFQE